MNINNPVTIALLAISLSFSIIQGTAYAADKNTIIGPTKAPLSKTKILEPEPSGSAGRRNDYDGYGRGYNGYNNTGRKLPSSTRPKTSQTLQRNTTNKQAQEAARRKALPGGTKALSPTNTRTTQSLNRNPLSKAELKASKKKTITTGVRSSSPAGVRISKREQYERYAAEYIQAQREIEHITSYVKLLRSYWNHISYMNNRFVECARTTDNLLGVLGLYDLAGNPELPYCGEQETRSQCYDRHYNKCVYNPTAPTPIGIYLGPPEVSLSGILRAYGSIDEANNRVKRHHW
ncbi:MAG: hypothetical protein DRQ44_08395 [Gammaproteobacteria bacterium]|nr:MAG: hypothetical protein DRQ44_08395 [Gammaproteobacteria bacterium]